MTHGETEVTPELWERVIWQRADADEEQPRLRNEHIIWQRAASEEGQPRLRSRSPRLHHSRHTTTMRRGLASSILQNVPTRDLVQELMRRFG